MSSTSNSSGGKRRAEVCSFQIYPSATIRNGSSYVQLDFTVTLQVVSVVSLESFGYIFKSSSAGSYVHWFTFLIVVIFFLKLKERRGLDSQLRGTVYHGGDIKGSTSLRM